MTLPYRVAALEHPGPGSRDNYDQIMELYNDEVPGSEVWAVVVTSMGTYDEHRYVDWFITPEASTQNYRDAVAYNKAHNGGQVQRWKVILPRRRMHMVDVTEFVEQALLRRDPAGDTQLLDVSVQTT